MSNIESMEKLANSFSKLPTVGAKTALRYAYSIINMNEQDVKDFAENLLNVKRNIHYCARCGNWCEKELCPICESATRDHSLLCVVEDPRDVPALERTREFSGVYHVLHGTISPMNGVGPEQLTIKSLVERVSKGEVKEVIMATNPTLEGDTTAMYIGKLLKPFEVKVTRLAYGIPVGADIEYADDVTLLRALEGRREL